ncbi:MAG: hypothetical protein J6O88_08800 [Chryseobacterium sp.]|uniref:hypothetical protein n=1 Tax=Chryseobacterium sp. TaxID=1871047 RepID=UPI001B0E3899|nr:hypothetical protein [Chryseobacterium sp.]MBO6184773.1 hypothetical protein [Chryseobacterium sp.]
MIYENTILNNSNKNETVSVKDNEIHKCWAINYKKVGEIKDYKPCIILTSYPVPHEENFNYLKRIYNSVGFYIDYNDFLKIDALDKCNDVYFIEILNHWSEEKIEEIVNELKIKHSII